MPIQDLLLSGVNLMFIGMGIVFSFLMVLVFAMKGMSKLAQMVSERQGVAETLSSQPSGIGQVQTGMRGDLVAVISAAITQFRANHN
ncbi:MAG: OadG family protein [Candidatus Thiodiazotropha sp.]|jgi:oxaloacetate decarboxylase (Na+ extruding) subunit gamma